MYAPWARGVCVPAKLKDGSQAQVSREKTVEEGRLHIMEGGQEHQRGADNAKVSRAKEGGLH